MKFTYRIDNINVTQGLAGVIYIPEHEQATPTLIKVGIEGIDLADIHAVIKEQAPIEWWELEIEKKATVRLDKLDAIVGQNFGSDSDEVATSRQNRDDAVPDVDHVAMAKQRIYTQAELATQELRVKYTPLEIETWTLQVIEAEKIITDPKIDPDEVPYLQAGSEAKGVSLLEFAQLVITKSKTYRRDKFAINEALNAVFKDIETLYQQRSELTISKREFIERLGDLSITSHLDSIIITTSD